MICLVCLLSWGQLFANDLQSRADTLVELLAEYKSLPAAQGFDYWSNRATMIETAINKRPDIYILPYLYNAVIAKKSTFSDNRSYNKDGLLILVNDERSVIWLSPLVYHPALNTLAQSYADYLYQNNHFSHVSLSGEMLADRIQTIDYPYSLIGENLAKWYTGIVQVLQWWMESPWHRANILEWWFVHMGLGRAGEYRVQLFGRPE